MNITWSTSTRTIDELVPYEHNPRRLTEKQYEDLKRSLEKFDLAEIPAINTDNTIIAGHQRLKILQTLGRGAETIDVRIPSRKLTKKELQEYNIRSNKNMGEWDFEMLANAFDQDDLVDWGFDVGEFGIEEEPDREGLTDDDEVPEVQEEPICKTGDLWQLGEHRLLCGDATVVTDVDRLMGCEKAELCLADPPYGVGYKYNDYVDTKENLDNIINDALPLIKEYAKRALITCGNSNQRKYPSPDWTLCWFVPAGVGRGPWGFTCWQPVLAYGADPYLEKGMGSRPDGFSITEGASSKEHPVAKPMSVWQWLMERGSITEGDVIFDPFGGSGTTLIACEKTGRKCRMMEIDPHYCDVIVKRWEDYTGNKAELVENV